jgi:hypothetical protein
MQAIEFDAVVQDRSIPLPSSTALSPGQPVRVVVMFEPRCGLDESMPSEDAIMRLARHPKVVPGFAPLSRDEAHER